MKKNAQVPQSAGQRSAYDQFKHIVGIIGHLVLSPAQGGFWRPGDLFFPAACCL